MGRPRKYPLETNTRDPQTSNRDPVIMEAHVDDPPTTSIKRKYKFWHYIKEPEPAMCPKCAGILRNYEGRSRYIDPVRKKIMQYKTCAHCGYEVGTVRSMTAAEEKEHCTHVDAVMEYQSDTEQ